MLILITSLNRPQILVVESSWLGDGTLGRSYSLTAKVTLLQGDKTCWITCVYGPQTDQEKLLFLDELREVRAACPGPWLILW